MKKKIIPAHLRKELLQSVTDDTNISEFCKKYEISRKTFYNWKKKYTQEEEETLEPKEKAYKVASNKLEAYVLEEIQNNPQLSVDGLYTVLFEKYGAKIKSRTWIQRFLTQKELSTIQKRRDYSAKKEKTLTKEKYLPIIEEATDRLRKIEKSHYKSLQSLQSKIQKIPLKNKEVIDEQTKLNIVSLANSGASVSEICERCQISRKTYYNWITKLKNSQSVASDTRGRPEILDPRIIIFIKDLVKINPEWSVDKLFEFINSNKEKQLVSRSTVQRVLHKFNLSTREARRVFSYKSRPIHEEAAIPTETDNLYHAELQHMMLARGDPPPPLRNTRLIDSVILPLQRIVEPKYHFISSYTYTKISNLLNKLPSPYKEQSHEVQDFIAVNLKLSVITAILATANAYTFSLLAQTVIEQESKLSQIGMILSGVGLFCGIFFFLYSMKYYITILSVLAKSQKKDFISKLKLNKMANLLNALGITAALEAYVLNTEKTVKKEVDPRSLFEEVEKVSLKRYPFFSIQIALYNEKKVADRVVSAAASMNYPNFEVLVCDDSTDETTQILQEKWGNHDKVKIVHREIRTGFKGAALNNALNYMNPKTDYVVVFDADFVPYPDTLTLFAKYYQVMSKIEDTTANTGLYDNKESYANYITTHNKPAEVFKGKTVAVQGYQWHVLNKSENWITRAVRTEFSGSYIIERSGGQIFGLLKQIAGSVYSINASVLKSVGWGSSITEDFQLTLKLYEQGYKVAYTPYIQAPSECVSTLKRLIRQRQRWAEGHSFNIKHHMKSLMTSKDMTLKEKWEALYLTPYYLQSLIFIVGTISWLIAETVLKARLPFWTAALGWSLVFTNLFSLPLMNTVGLFLEEGEERDYLGIFSFITLCYILAPFIGFAALKGFLEDKEGPWFRTPKSGRITDKVEKEIHTERKRENLLKHIPWIKPVITVARKIIPQLPEVKGEIFPNSYLAYQTAGNTFDSYKRRRGSKNRRVGRIAVAVVVLISMHIGYLTAFIPLAQAAPGTEVKTVEYFIYQYASGTDITTGNGINGLAYNNTNDVTFTVNLPESGALTVRHAYVEWHTRMDGTTDVTSGEMKFDQCDGACTRSNTTQTLGAQIAQTAETEPTVLRMNVASEVTGGSHTYKFNGQLTGTSRNADNAKLVVTYEYDDTATTQLRTRRYFVACDTGTTNPTSGTVDPNIQEQSATAQSAWVEYTGNFNSAGSGDGSVSIDINSNAGAEVNTDDLKGSSYDLFVMRDVTANLNLDSNNTIDLDDTTQAIGNKCAELVVTYSFAPFNTPVVNQGNTVVYAMGQNSGDIPGSHTTIGTSRTVTLPEASITYDSVWIRYTFTSDSAATFVPKIVTSRNVVGQIGSQHTIPAPSEQDGKHVILYDVTSFLSNTSNFQSGDTVAAQARVIATGGAEDVGAELIFSYRHNQSGTNLNGIKTVYWFVGQRTTAATTDFTGSFTTYLPESSETYNSSAIVMDAPKAAISTTPIVDRIHSGTTTCSDAGAADDNTDASYLGTNETITTRMLSVTPLSMSNMSGQTVNYCLQVGSTITDVVSAYGYTTYTASIITLPENAIVFALILVVIPKIVHLIFCPEERKRYKEYFKNREYTAIFKSLLTPYQIVYRKIKQQKGVVPYG